MAGYFDYNYDGPPFELFGTGHLVSLALFLFVLIYLPFAISDWRAGKALDPMRTP